MDQKMAAAGERLSSNDEIESELNDTKKFSEENYRAWCDGAVAHMIIYLGLRLSELEQKVWLDHFVQYPKWKLDRLSEYTLDDRGGGRTLAHVCSWLDRLMPEVERDTRTDLGYKKLEYKPNQQIAKDVTAYTQKIALPEYARTAAGDQLEREFIAEMKQKYPHLSWMCGRKNNLTGEGRRK